jgi:hypothetical protein
MKQLLVGLLLAASSLLSVALLQPAASAHAEDKGNLISNAIFINQSTMTESQIQNFINAFPQSCLLPQNQPGGLSPVTFKEPLGYFSYGNDVSPARIIWKASQLYGLNPQVLLATLEKEQNLVTGAAGCAVWKYNSSMGYNCPDGSENALKDYPNIGVSRTCVAQESNATFSRQVNHAAWQFRFDKERADGNLDWGGDGNVWYYGRMTQGNRARQIGQPATYYDGYTVIDGVSIYLANGATASLYNYTPHFNSFYTIFTRWFGSTQYGDFVRTLDNATVYLVGDKIKYPISDASLLGAASTLGAVDFVPQSYLDSVPTGALLGRTIQSPDGTIYFYDSSIKLPFTSCAMVSAYGSSCGGAALLTQSQINKFVTGPSMTNGMKTTSGRTYYVESGAKREVLDSQSLSNAGISVGYNVLTDQSLSNLTQGMPFVRDNVIIKNRQNDSARYLMSGGVKMQITNTPSIMNAFSSLPQGMLDGQSIDKLSSGAAVGGLIKDENGTAYLLTPDGKKTVPNPQSFPSSSITALPSQLISQLSGSGSASNPSLIKSYDNETVYAVVNGQKRPLVAMEDLKSITGQSSPYIAWLSNEFVNSIPTGNIIVGAGRLVKTPTSATVYMTDGYDKLIPMSTFDTVIDMGVPLPIRVISDTILSKYTVDSTILSSYISCNGNTYVTIGGFIYPIVIDGKNARILQSQTCNMLTVKSTLPGFLLAPNGTIFQFKEGKIYPISSWSKYTSLSASGGSTVGTTYSTLSLFPQGPTL